MTMFQIGFLVTALGFMGLDILGAVLSFKKGGPAGRLLGVTCTFCSLVVLTYLASVMSVEYFSYSCFTSLHYICVMSMLVCVVAFTFHLVELADRPFVPYVNKLLLILVSLDAVCWIINPFKEIMLSFAARPEGFNRFDLVPSVLFGLHLTFTYVMAAVVVCLLVYKWVRSDRDYHRKYRFALLGFSTVVMFSAVSELFPGFLGSSRLDYTVFALSLAAAAFYWSAFIFSTERYVYDHSVPLEQRTNTMFVVTGIIGTTCGLLICLAASVSFAGIMAVASVVLAMMVISVVARKTGHEDLGFWILIACILVAMPIVWLSAGGVSSGVNSWFVYEFFYIAFALKGRRMYIAMAIAFVLDGASYGIGYYRPDFVYLFTNMADTYISTVASTFVVGITVVVTVLYQKNIYYDEQAALQEAYKTQELLKREAEKANNAKSDFLASMSHEIRTPINAVLGMDEMILRGGTPEEIAEYARNIKLAGNMLLSLVNDVLDFSKIESGKMNIVPVEYRLSNVLADLKTMIATKVEERGLELKTEISPDLPSVLVGDDFRLRQIIMNLLTNAVKYTPKGSVTLKVWGETADSKCKLYVSVKDTGVGVREEDKPRLLESFKRLEETRNRGIEGTGLGLSITEKLLELMGSSLQIKSEYGKGSEFYFVLSQDVVDGAAIGNADLENADGQKSVGVFQECFEAPEAKILVVDDNRMNLMVVRGLLKNSRMQIDCVESGQECLNKVEENCYQVILMDHMMPQMDGVETLERLKAKSNNKSAEAKVVALTANAMSGAQEMYLARGFDDFLAKPVRGSLLEKVLLRHLPAEMVHMKSDEAGVAKPEAKTESVLIDFEKGLALCVNDRGLYKEVLQSLPDEHFDYYLQEYYEKSDWANYRVKVHALKSCLVNVGADKVSLMAKKLEDAAKEENFKVIFESHPALMEEFRKVLLDIQRYCDDTLC